MVQCIRMEKCLHFYVFSFALMHSRKRCYKYIFMFLSVHLIVFHWVCAPLCVYVFEMDFTNSNGRFKSINLHISSFSSSMPFHAFPYTSIWQSKFASSDAKRVCTHFERKSTNICALSTIHLKLRFKIFVKFKTMDLFVCPCRSFCAVFFPLRWRIKAIRANFLLAAISVLVCLRHHRRRWRWQQHRQLSPVTWVNCIKWWMHFFFVLRPVCLQCSIAALSLRQWTRKKETLSSMEKRGEKKAEKRKQNKTKEGVKKEHPFDRVIHYNCHAARFS